MAQSHAAMLSPFDVARAGTRNIRVTVVVSVVLICGSFAAAAALQMKNDRVRALEQAEYFEARRGGDVAAAADASLVRIEALGRAFAGGKEVREAAHLSGIRNITVFDRTRAPVARLWGDTVELPPRAGAAEGPAISASSIMTIPLADGVVAIAFDPRALVPASMLERAALTTANGAVLIQDENWTGSGATVPVGTWPLVVRTSVDEDSALRAWTGSLPLYLFVILGPALVGAGLAAIFVGEFERRARADGAIRALRATRPVEAKLLVRLAQAELRAADDLRAKSEFIAHMSHELRTPLNAIIGFSEVIEQSFFGPVGHAKYVEYAHDINQAGRNLHGKIGDILEFANIEAGRYPLEPKLIDIAKIVEDCVGECAGKAFSRRVALNLGFVAAAEALADPLAVRRIVNSLLSNALLYTQEGGQVRVEVHEEDGAVVVSIADNGTGFTRLEAATAGVPFRSHARQGTTTGLGMGLTIAMALARRMGGAIRIGGLSGEGTVAELRLPKL